ncbi:WecB/TagA/CpsF family glycosyltransferase [Synechocystis salina LEGE 06155]|nr:WecB/TagA/CpsF family glycosyltransferase [Synechocystis salina LEGE 06155]
MNSITLLNTTIHNYSMIELLEALNKGGGFVVTPNVDHMVKLQEDAELQEVYQVADYRVCDSKIIEYILKLLGTPIKEKISGSDLFPAFYEYNKDNPDTKIFLLGAKEGVADRARQKINGKVGREIIVDSYSPSFGFEQNPEECAYILERIKQSGATVLAVGLGAPKQEKWIAKYRHQLPNIKVFLAIGATIDFEAGEKARSPQWMSQAGLEWLHRLASEPQRLWKRYLVESLPFFALVLQYRLQTLLSEPA